jgi:predicted RNase H-like nuclease
MSKRTQNKIVSSTATKVIVKINEIDGVLTIEEAETFRNLLEKLRNATL